MVSPPPARRASTGQVMPFARALSLLRAFTPHERWLGLGHLAQRAGLAPSTAARLARALAACGYLHHDADTRRYRLTASVMALGYGAGIDPGIRQDARLPMADLARKNNVHVMLCGRERLDLLVVDACNAPGSAPPCLHVGSRVGITSSPMGWALLAVLPEPERHYLMENIEQRAPRDWMQQRRHMGEAIAQVREMGWCKSVAVAGEAMTMIAAPLRPPGQPPLVLACIGPGAGMARARVERELGPRLAATAASILAPRAP